MLGVLLRPGPPGAQAPERARPPEAPRASPDAGPGRPRDRGSRRGPSRRWPTALHLVPHAAREVLQQPRQQAGAHHRLLDAERVHERHRRVLAAQHLQALRSHERVVHHLVSPAPESAWRRRRSASAEAGSGRQLAPRREAAARGCCRSRGRGRSPPGDPPRAPRPRGPGAPRRSSARRPPPPPEPERAEDASALGLGHGRAEQRLHPPVAQRHAPRRLRARVHVHAARGHRAAGQLRDQLRGPIERRNHRVDVRAALEAVRRLGVQAVALGGAAHAGGLEVRGLEDDASSCSRSPRCRRRPSRRRWPEADPGRRSPGHPRRACAPCHRAC